MNTLSVSYRTARNSLFTPYFNLAGQAPCDKLENGDWSIDVLDEDSAIIRNNKVAGDDLKLCVALVEGPASSSVAGKIITPLPFPALKEKRLNLTPMSCSCSMTKF